MSKFRKKPVVIEAIEFKGSNRSFDNVWAWAVALGGDVETFGYWPHTSKMEIATLEGIMTASADDWIIRGVNGEFYPCKPDIFEKTYEAVEEELS